jgi:phospholipase C
MAEDPIKHVIVLELENRSFDQMLGCFKEIFPELEGVDPAAPHTNLDHTGQPFSQKVTRVRQMPSSKPFAWDPHHETSHVDIQINGEKTNPGRMGGFVLDFSTSYPDSTPEARQYIMDYYERGFLPALHTLAENFTICDHWFSSLPGPTWPNRFFALSGTASGRVSMPGDGTHHADIPGFFQQHQDTIFDRLNEKGIHWKSYFHDIPQSWVLGKARKPHNAARYFYFREFFHDARGPEEEFPQFCFIEPDFMGFQQNDDHPPHDIMKGEKLIADVYNALRHNHDLWHKSLLVVFFDEHGGFYDHVYPPPAVRPDEHHEEHDFQQLGVRVPALLVSPWVGRRVEHTQFDHTSLLKYLTEKWGLGPLGARVAQANSLGVAIAANERGDDTPHSIVLKREQLEPPDLELEDEAFGVSVHHTALRKFTTYLRFKRWMDLLTAATVEGVPQLYAPIARTIEGLVFTVMWITREFLSSFGKQHLTASISQPDKLHTDSATPRDDVAWFLMHRKEMAVGILSKLLDQPGVEREQAIRTLASMTGRPLHRYPHHHTQDLLEKHGDNSPPVEVR